MELPKALIDNVRDGKCVLFLGAGAAKGATHKKYSSPPNSRELADILAEKFLGSQYIGKDLAYVTELAISEHDIIKVQEFIASIYKDLEPADFHKLITKFSWRGITTTNFDLIIEKSYNEVKNPIQIPIVITKDGERIDEKLRSPKHTPYFKLHGCVTNIYDQDLPLILTPEQYIDHKKNRIRLFEKVLDLAIEYPFIFIGHSLSDIDIRTFLHELENLKEAKPRSYIITPEMEQAEKKYWEGKKFTHIQSTFKEFLEELDRAIPSTFRVLSTIININEKPISKKLSLPQDYRLSESLLSFLNRDVDYLSADFKSENINPKAFYKGYFIDWSPIIGNLDVRRSLTDTILSEIFLPSEDEKRELCEFILLKGHAGSGKTVLLKRLAWEASVNFDRFCLFTKQESMVEFEPLAELSRLCKERIFLFLDPVTEYSEVIEDILTKARKERIPLTIISAERFNEWNELCSNLEPYVSSEYKISYLSDREIEELIGLLKIHHSLGYLEDKSIEEQREELGKRSGRQILVALHEATLGKPFTDIVFDEYNSIISLRAKSLYLTVCIFHRLNVPVRAGLIARIHNISFLEFKEQLFLPLENVVFSQINEKIRDYEYRTRHSHIAEIVFERVLLDPQSRYDEYMRIINAIDVDYASDQEAFKGITNARELQKLFSNPEMIREIFKTAKKRDEKNPMLLQQEAIFEMNSPNGSLSKATTLLREAISIAPYLKPIIHSLSELAKKKADKSTRPLEKQKYINEAKRLAQELISSGSNNARPYNSLIRIGLDELENLIKSEENDDAIIERKTKEIESLIQKTIQLYPDDTYVLDAESNFCTLINDSDRALKALEKAFCINKRNAYVATRLSKIYARNNDLDKSTVVLQECLEANPNDKTINFHLAMALLKNEMNNRSEIRHLLRRSFTDGDINYIAQFWYARHLYIDGELPDSLVFFNRLGNLNIDSRIKHQVRGVISENDQPKKFYGMIINLELTYCYILRDSNQDRIYSFHRLSSDTDWGQLRNNKRISFELGFNYHGPIALNITTG